MQATARVFGCSTRGDHKPVLDYWAGYWPGPTALAFLYAAEVHGFGSCPMIGFDPVAVASEFSLLPDEIPVRLVAIGRAATNNWPQKADAR